MVKEVYCSFDVAKLLKEKGFVTSCDWLYCSDGTFGHRNSLWDKEMFPAPTHQMAMKWLREVHNCSIEITSNGYLMDNDATWECDIKFRHRLYFRHIQCQKTYEDCAEAALKYVLENLI